MTPRRSTGCSSFAKPITLTRPDAYLFGRRGEVLSAVQGQAASVAQGLNPVADRHCTRCTS
jgi:hypothetical protein